MCERVYLHTNMDLSVTSNGVLLKMRPTKTVAELSKDGNSRNTNEEDEKKIIPHTQDEDDDDDNYE